MRLTPTMSYVLARLQRGDDVIESEVFVTTSRSVMSFRWASGHLKLQKVKGRTLKALGERGLVKCKRTSFGGKYRWYAISQTKPVEGETE